MGDLMDLGKRIADLNGEMARGLAEVSDAQALERFRVEYLGRKGRIAQLFKALAEVAPDDKGEAGRLLNELKHGATSAFEERAARLTSSELQERLLRESVDVTLPGVCRPFGHLHPLTQVQREIESIFMRMGFDVATGPEIETEYYNFEALNIPADHPARADWDTFYISDTTLLRPHTSPVQIHVMESTPPPVRIICPGRCYRR
ncbi:MAG: phenylalanine--tRNA ligase subunit alpha, partial [Candidatus Bipolaricaulota bacterium]|nr:phenylalanine--tRNA ligase subunit alpha [Candidatus Bipolaricaulota bacterium]